MRANAATRLEWGLWRGGVEPGSEFPFVFVMYTAESARVKIMVQCTLYECLLRLGLVWDDYWRIFPMKTVFRLCMCCHLWVNMALFGTEEPVFAQTVRDETPATDVDSAKQGKSQLEQGDLATAGYAGHFSCRVFLGVDRELCIAVSDGEVLEMKRLIEAGANIEAKSVEKTTEGMTPLMVAVRYGWGLEAVELLLEAGADVNARDARGSSVLIRALENRPLINYGIVRSLIERGADVKTKSSKEMTPLMHAAMIDDPGCAAMMLSAGGEVNARDTVGWTALMHANRRKSGFPEVVRLLIKYRADVNAAHKYGGTALMIAAYNCHPQAAQLLVDSGADVNARDKSGWTPLICGAKGGCAASVGLLIEAGAELNAQDRFGKTALAYGSDTGHVIIARLLKEAGAEP
jgi:ankyrin repeat protein